MTLNLSESNKNSNYYLSQIDDIRELSEATKIQVDDIQTDVDTIQTDLSTAQGQISALITAGSAGESQIALDAVIVDTTTNTGDISDMKIDITDLQAKTAFIESVTASATTQTEKTIYLNDQGGEIGYIGPQGDAMYIGCSASTSLVINPDQGYITHYCENTFFGDNNGPGRLILGNSNGLSGSITINNEVQSHAYTVADRTRLNAVDSDIAYVQNQLNTTNNDVSTVTTENVATQVQLDLVAADLNTAETFILGHTDDIAALTVLTNTNITNIDSNDTDIAGILTEINTINTTIANGGVSNQTQVDAIQVSVNAHTDDITALTTLVNTNTINIQSNDADITGINTQLGTINTNVTAVSSANSATQLELDGVAIDLNTAETTIATHTTQIGTINTNITAISANNATTQSQVDIVSTDLGTAETDIVNLQTNVNALGSDNTKQTNYISTFDNDPLVTNYSEHFNFDVLCYYDFSDPNNLGKDMSGKNLHATNTHGVVHSTENTNSAYFKKITHTATAGQYTNQRHLNCTAALPYLKQDEYTISINVLPLVTDSTVFSFTKNDANNSYFYIYFAGGDIKVVYRFDGFTQVAISYPFPLDGNWHNIVFTNKWSGTALYIDNVKVDASYYTSGTINTPCDLASLDETRDKLILGGIAIALSNRGDVYRYPYEGYMSDFIMYNRILSALEIEMLSSGVVGYDVILLVGQSNMTGEADIEAGIDDDYSLHNNRVYQYETINNIDVETSPYNYNGITNVMSIATGPLAHPQPAVLGAIASTKMGPWKTFIDDYIRYSEIPFRKNILIVPLAAGGSSFQVRWNPGLRNYEIALKAMDQIMNESLNPSKSYKVTAMLFNMGEADISLLNNDFKTDFITTYNSFVSNLNGFNVDVPVVLTQISGEYEHIRLIDTPMGINVSMQQEINARLVELANEYDKFQLVSTEGLTYKADLIHIDIEGQRALGERMFDKFMSILGKANKKPAYGVNNNIKDVVMQSDLLLKPKNELDQWTNLKLNCFATKELTILCTGALTDTITLKFVKLGPIVIVSMDTLLFTADANGSIDVAVGSIPEELATNMTHKYTCDTHTITFITDGDFVITNNDSAAGNMYTGGTIYTLQAFFCMYTTN